MFKKIKDILYSIKRGIQNIINWLPIIWQDENFDDHYFNKIMLHKLQNMEKFFRSDYCLNADWEKEADDIHYVVKLLERITNDVYLEEALEPFYKKYPNYQFKFEFEQDENNPKLHKLVDNDTKEQKLLLKECYKKSDELEKEDYDKLYKYLPEHIREWWD